MLDAVVVGGGPAGSAAAIRLARAGARVRLYEKQAAAHHKVCGEFVSGEAVADLTALGVDVRALGALPLDSVGLAAGEVAACALPFAAVSLSRFVLDEALLEHAVATGVDVRRGAAVRLDALPPSGAVFVATGKHDLPGHHRPPGTQPDLIGLKQYFAARAPMAARVDLIPFAGGYAGLQPVPGGQLNLCLLVHRRTFTTFDALVAQLRRDVPALDAMLGEPAWPKPVAIARIPYGFVRRASTGHYWLGDQAAVIPSFAGDGIAIALHSARRATEAFTSGAGATRYQRDLATELRGQVWRATCVSRLLVRPWFAPVAHAAARVVPSLVRAVALATRVPATT